MFTYIKLRNFKSFRNVCIDLENKKNIPKSMAVIYGANGSGKSTIVQAFLTLKKTMGTMQVKDLLKDLLDNKITPPDDIPLKPELMLEFIKSRLANNTIEKIIEESKMIGTSDDMLIEFGFTINGSTGRYLMQFDNSDLIHERLEYKILKNRGCCFDIEDGKVDINSNLFESEDFFDEIKKQIQMYWGKHSLLSILKYEMEEKSGAYINSNISNNLMNVLSAFDDTSYKMQSMHDVEDSSLRINNPILQSLEGGMIEKPLEKELDKVEKVLNQFFTSLFDDVNRAFYKRSEKKGRISYSLFFNKQIEKYKYDIDFKYESSGTQEILELIPYLMLAIAGKTVVIDEYGNGIHDLLATRLMREVAKNIKGQLIITTHNTLLMDQAEIKPESLYFIMNDKTFNKSVKCVTEIEERLHPNYNYRNRYFNNELYSDGLPKNSDKIDFTELAKLYT